jgi:hypothetical protein
VAAGEDQAQPVIDELGHVVRLRLAARQRGEGGVRLELRALLGERTVAAQPVDRLAAGRSCQPGARVRRHAVLRPARQRNGHRILERHLR